MQRCVPKNNFMINLKHISLLHLAPRRLEFGKINTNAISVSAIAPSVSTGIDHFEMFVKTQPGKKCTTGSGKRTCDVRELSPATQYTFRAKSCLAPHGSGACGDGTDGTTWTKPTGNLRSLTYTMEPENLLFFILFQPQMLQRLTAAQQAKLLSPLQQWLRKITSWSITQKLSTV